MSEKDSENTVLWIVGGLFVIVAVMVGLDHFRKPAPRAPAAPPAAAAPAQPQSMTAAATPANGGPAATAPEPPTYNPRAVLEDPEYADVAPKLPTGVRAPERLQMSRNPTEQMRAALRALIIAQEIYLADNGFMRYASRVDDLKEMPVISGVTVALRSNGAVGYVASATHSSLPGKQCALYVGTPPMAPAKVTGQIGCD